MEDLFLVLFYLNSSASSFRKLNSLTFQIFISQYFICTCSIFFPLTILTFFTSFQQILLQSCSFQFLNFSFHYSLNKVLSFSGFFICITMNFRNVAFLHKWFSLVQKVNFSNYLFVFIFRCMNALALSWTLSISSLYFLFRSICISVWSF